MASSASKGEEPTLAQMAYQGGQLTFQDKPDSAVYTALYREFQRAMSTVQAPGPALTL